MAAAGFSVIRVGESTWSTWSPRTASSTWSGWPPSWTVRARSIHVILGTPLPVPPWLARRYTEIAGGGAPGQHIP